MATKLETYLESTPLYIGMEKQWFDYIIVPIDMFGEVVSFSVGEYSTVLSEHCRIFYEIKAS